MEADVGDIVKVVNSGNIYPSYRSFFNEQGYPDLLPRFKSYCGDETSGRVVFKGEHARGVTTIYCVELGAEGGRLVLVGEPGIEIVSKGIDWVLPDIDKSEMSISDFLEI